MSADISVIIAAFNVESYIERAIRSALEQKDVTVEVVVVNDASTDNTASVVSSIADARVKLINLPANGGPSAARNAAIEAAAGTWIAVLDGDDAFLPDRLSRCMIRARAVAADIVVDNLLVKREADGAEYLMYAPAGFPWQNILDLAHFIGRNRSFVGGGEALGYLKPIFSAEFVKRNKLRYNTELRNSEDYLFLCEALALGARCVVEGVAGYNYTVRKGSISHRLTPADVMRIIEGDKKFLARYKLDAAAAKAQEAREESLKEALAYTQLLDALKAKNPVEALKAISSYPPCIRHLWQPVWVRLRRPFVKRVANA